MPPSPYPSLSIGLLLVFAACEALPPAAVVESVDVSPPLMYAPAGATREFSSTVTDAEGRTLPDHPVVWSSSDEHVATIDAAGRATTRRDGMAIITAEAAGIAADATLRVRTWRELGGGMDLAYYPYSSTLYGDDLVIGTTGVGRGTLTAFVRLWDGMNWETLGTFDGHVNALLALDEALIAGGSFNTVDGDSVHSVARWDGAVWHPMGHGRADVPEGSLVRALVDHEGTVVASFGPVRGAPSIVARWDGAEWQRLGAEFNGRIGALAVRDGELFAGGSFTAAGNEDAHYVARWDGAEWYGVGSGLDGPVRTLLVREEEVLAGGDFTRIHEEEATGVARWTDSGWTALTGGADISPITALTVHDGHLIAGGGPLQTRAERFDRIALWDGSSWHTLADQTNYAVFTLEVYDGRLTAGGMFSEPARHIMIWGGG